jgi:hypothetical protein
MCCCDHLCVALAIQQSDLEAPASKPWLGHVEQDKGPSSPAIPMVARVARPVWHHLARRLSWMTADAAR